MAYNFTNCDYVKRIVRRVIVICF